MEDNEKENKIITLRQSYNGYSFAKVNKMVSPHINQEKKKWRTQINKMSDGSRECYNESQWNSEIP